MAGIEAGKHRVVLRQESGKVTIDRLRFEDFQYYQRSSLLIPTNTSATLFTRYKVVAEQAKWYQGTGLQSTEGAYDTPRVNPDSGIPDKSVPIKYRVRLRTELNADGTKEERGTAYVTSAIFETGKLSSHWRRSESADLFPTSRLQQWNPSQPHNTGIQHDHLANGSVRGAKILANAIMDYHISNYARIQEHKLQLNYPTHGHTNKAVLDTIVNWAGTSGNYGTANTLARGDHAHDYLPLTGGRLTGTTNTRDIFTSGNITVTGNIVVTGTIDSVDVSILSGNVATVSGNLNSHIGAGGSAHALATSGSAGFLSSADFTKLQGISANSINQAFTDVTYAKLSGNNLNGTTIGKSMEHGSNSIILGNNDWTPLIYSVSTGKAYYNQAYRGVTLSGNGIWTKVKTRLPVDPESTYFVRAKITKKSGTGTVYIGADSLDNNYASISTDSAQSYNYFGATGVTIASGNTQYLEGKISGYNPAGSSGGVHTMFDPEAKYFDLVLIANYGDTLNGETVVEWLELYKAPNTFYVGSNGVIHSGNFNTSTLNGHVGSGGSAHAVAISGGANGFIDGTNYGKLLRIQDNAINQATADARYLNITGGALTGTGNLTLNGLTINIGEGLQFLGDNNYFATNSDARIIRIVDVNDTGGNADGGLIFQSYTTTDSTAVELLRIRNTEFKWKGNDIIHAGTFNIATLNGHIGSGGSAHALAVSGGSAGFISGTDKAKLDNIQVNAINESYANTKFLTLTGGTLTGDLTINTNLKFGSNIIRAGGASNNALVLGATSGGVYLRPNGDTDTNGEFLVTSSNATYKGYTVWHSGNFVPSSKSDVGHIHADVISNGASGFITGADKAKLDTIAVSANNYVHPTGDGNNHVPANGTTNNNKVLKATAIAGSYAWGSVDWTELTSVPSTFAPSAHTHTASQITDLYSNIYTKTEVDTAVANAGDIKANQANVFKNLNTFNNAGMAIKIQPSAGVANATKLLQLNNVSGNELFSVNYSGGVSIAGDFVVTGQQIVSGTTNVNGDYTISGQLIVGGNSTLGDASTDVTTVNGTLKVQNGSIQEVGKYVQVHRRPVYGIAGDLQFQTDSNVFEDITDYYDLSAYALPAVQTGATRYYRLYVVYSDDITSTQASGGQVATVRISGATNKDLDLPWTWGAVNGRRDWYSAYFTDLPTGNGRIQAKLAQTGNNLGIRWVELVAYDKF
jgi:hypothetical protein